VGLERYEAFRSYLDPDPSRSRSRTLNPSRSRDRGTRDQGTQRCGQVSRPCHFGDRGSPCVPRSELAEGDLRYTNGGVRRPSPNWTRVRADSGVRRSLPNRKSVVPDASGVIQVEADPGHPTAVGDDAGASVPREEVGAAPSAAPPRRAKIRKIRSRRPRPTLRQGTQQRHGKTRPRAGGFGGSGYRGDRVGRHSDRVDVQRFQREMMRRRSTRRTPRAARARAGPLRPPGRFRVSTDIHATLKQAVALAPA